MKSFIVLRKELKRLNENIIFFLGIILISILPIVINFFVLKDNLQNSRLAAIRYFDTSFLLGMYLIPLIIFSIYYYDKESDVLIIINTNPISVFQYRLGKFFTAICFYLQCILLGSSITIILPVFYYKDIYSIYTFITTFLLFSFPRVVFFTSLSNLINIIFRHSVISIIIPLFIFFILDKISLFSSTSYLTYSMNFISGNYKFIRNLITIDSIYFVIAIIFIVISTNLYCNPNNY
ncbi:hypothetical protein [Clostridium niameyense]|uniref:hypothetical protein n=1 Tax=Clostridium niameyense TaxID=1622073 RepID=UPI00067EAC37|nr:hypothetical protein [Clostridium niameyense]